MVSQRLYPLLPAKMDKLNILYSLWILHTLYGFSLISCQNFYSPLGSNFKQYSADNHTDTVHNDQLTTIAKDVLHTNEVSMRALVDVATPEPTQPGNILWSKLITDSGPFRDENVQFQSDYLNYYYDLQNRFANDTTNALFLGYPFYNDITEDPDSLYVNTPPKEHYYYLYEEILPNDSNLSLPTRTSLLSNIFSDKSMHMKSDEPQHGFVLTDHSGESGKISHKADKLNKTSGTRQLFTTHPTPRHDDAPVYGAILSSTEKPRASSNDSDAHPMNSGEPSQCGIDSEPHRGCDVIHYERCDSDSRTCQCLNGYLRGAEGRGPCRAASFYHGHVTIAAVSPARQVQSIRHQLLQTIREIFLARDVDGVLDIIINSWETGDSGTSISFDLALAKSSLPDPGKGDNVENLWDDLVLRSSSGHWLSLLGRNITANAPEKGSSLFSPLVEVNQCSRQAYHHCSSRALCKHTSTQVICSCQPGFQDVSESLHRLPGEVCVETCSCKNGGICINLDESSGIKQCSCLAWYFGNECEIDGKELLVICSCSLATVIFIVLILCCSYHACVRHKDSAAKSKLFRLTPEPNVLKLPRVWMDTGSFHTDLSPHNHRRMSVASATDVNEYFGGFILEDIPGPSLPRHTDALTSYYQTTANLCGVPTSSQQALFRY